MISGKFMKILRSLSVACFACAMHPAAAEETDATAVIANVQDERIADVEAVQAALKAPATPEQKAAIQAAFLQREGERAAEAGAASLQAELARQSASAAQPAATAARDITPSEYAQ